MKFERVTLAFLGAAFLAGVALVAVPVPGFDPASAPAPALRPSASRAKGDAGAALERTLAQRERAQVLAFGRDPFRAPSPAPADPAPPLEAAQAVRPEATRPSLTGISSYDGARWAIIDREIVREGQCLSSGFTVERIEHGSVTLRRDQEQVVLVLGAHP